MGCFPGYDAVITVTTRALRTELVTADDVKRLLFDSVATSSGQLDANLADLIRRASAAVQTYCSRPFAREVYSETAPGYGSIELMLSRTPIIRLGTITYRSDPITDASIADALVGTLYRELGWDATPTLGWNITDFEYPNAQQPYFTVAYTAGYLLSGDNLASTAIIVTSSDSSFNLVSSGFPLLSSGDVIDTTGFAQAVNNGRFTVASRTASKITVAETLVGEGSTTTATSTGTRMFVRTLPGDIEAATLEAIRAWYLGRARDPNVESRSVGDLSVSYRGGWGAVPVGALPYTAQALLAPWVRSA